MAPCRANMIESAQDQIGSLCDFQVSSNGQLFMKTARPTLPLHHGHVPSWLAGRMRGWAAWWWRRWCWSTAAMRSFGGWPNPFWFSGARLRNGMDWHSSGITTSVLGALKRGLAPVQWELGLHVCGDAVRHSRHTPAELLALGERVSVDAPAWCEPAAWSRKWTAQRCKTVCSVPARVSW